MSTSNRASDMAKLVKLADNKFEYDLKVLAFDWYMYTATKRSVHEFVETGRILKDYLKNECGDSRRTWRDYPLIVTAKDREALLKHISKEEYQVTAECIENGL
jgi:hypothetical protein